MSDEVEGAGLVWTDKGGAERLIVQCEKGEWRQVAHVPVCENGLMCRTGEAYRYGMVGDTMHLTPNLRVLGHDGLAEAFHTGVHWTVRVVRFDPARYDFPFDHFQALQGPHPQQRGHD